MAASSNAAVLLCSSIENSFFHHWHLFSIPKRVLKSHAALRTSYAKQQQSNRARTRMHTYSFSRQCVLCNRINILDPLHSCTRMKCIQKDASMNQKCQHYLFCNSILLLLRSSFVSEGYYLVLCLARLCLYGLLNE